jgi:hypothetical protein
MNPSSVSLGIGPRFDSRQTQQQPEQEQSRETATVSGWTKKKKEAGRETGTRREKKAKHLDKYRRMSKGAHASSTRMPVPFVKNIGPAIGQCRR